MWRALLRLTRKKKKAINLFLTSIIFFVCLNVSVRNFSETGAELSLDAQPETVLERDEGSYNFTDDLVSKYKDPPPPPKDLLVYKPICSNLNDEAKHAIKRAQTNHCKQLIADEACKLNQNRAIPMTVHNTCKRFENASLTRIRHFGCYRDDRSNRVLGLASKWLTDDNSIEKCIEFCRDGMGAAYAGTEYGTECHCGYKINPSTELNFRLCNVVCPGDHLQSCGGDLAINVYSTGAGEVELPKKPTENTRPAVLAFHLGVNGRKVRQIKQMLQGIYSPKHYYLIHVDQRQAYLYGELKKLEETFPNVRMQQERFKGIWGAPSLYQILRAGMKELLSWAPDWDFYINLSESCFPVQKLDVIEKYYGANEGKNFLWSYSNFPDNRLKQNRLMEHFVECDEYVFDIGERKWPKNLKVDSGADWYTMHRGFAEFVSDRNNPLIRELEMIQNHSFVPTENFFHMALQNSQFCYSRVNVNHRILNWGDFPDGQCNHYEYGDYGGCSPKSFRYEDLPRLTQTHKNDNFFARKFDNSASQSVMTALEEHVFGEWPQDTPALESFWECVYHHKYDKDPAIVQFSKYLFSFLVKTKKIDFMEKGTLLVSGLDEVNTFFDDDRYQGTLLRYKIKNPELSFEAYLQPKRQMIRPDMRRSEQGRLKFMRIGPDYNKKERMFKNPLLYIDSKVKVITIEHMWEISDSRENVTFYWIGPSNNIFNMSEVEIKAKQEMTFLIFEIEKELQPGVWSLMIETFGRLVGYVDFPVFPAGPQTAMNNPTSVLTGAARVGGEVNEFLASRSWPEFYKYSDMTDYLIKRFYKIHSLCILPSEPSKKSVIPNCQGTKWSSLSPDPKSEFKRLNS